MIIMRLFGSGMTSGVHASSNRRTSFSHRIMAISNSLKGTFFLGAYALFRRSSWWLSLRECPLSARMPHAFSAPLGPALRTISRARPLVYELR